VGAALADGSWQAWVAEDDDGADDGADGLVVGHVYAARIGKLPNPVDEAETHLYVSNLYVLPEHRGRGLGRALLDAVLAEAEGTDTDTDTDIDATILWARPGTAALYERYGFGFSPELMERRP
jgi:GNAT superfamily N-acetyltransferase